MAIKTTIKTTARKPAAGKAPAAPKAAPTARNPAAKSAKLKAAEEAAPAAAPAAPPVVKETLSLIDEKPKKDRKAAAPLQNRPFAALPRISNRESEAATKTVAPPAEPPQRSKSRAESDYPAKTRNTCSC